MINSIRVGPDFPLQSGEMLRIKLPRTQAEIRIRVRSNQGEGVYLAKESWYPGPGTNKEMVSMLSDPKRKLETDRGNPRRRKFVDDWREED